jgi:hypothetical protein
MDISQYVVKEGRYSLVLIAVHTPRVSLAYSFTSAPLGVAFRSPFSNKVHLGGFFTRFFFKTGFLLTCASFTLREGMMRVASLWLRGAMGTGSGWRIALGGEVSWVESLIGGSSCECA